MIAVLDGGDTAAAASTIGWALLVTALGAVLGLGISTVLHDSTGAIGGLPVWSFVGRNQVRLFLADEIARFLPVVTGPGASGSRRGVVRLRWPECLQDPG